MSSPNYRPADLWTGDDDLVFPSKRNRCHHTPSSDSSCRPHELLKLRTKDVVLETCGRCGVLHDCEKYPNSKSPAK